MSELRAILFRFMRAATSAVLAAVARVVTGVRPLWVGALPSDRQRIYFANHASHGDFILLSACLPPRERARTRAVAGADYWGKTRLRRFIAEDMLSSVLVERTSAERKQDPLAVMLQVLDEGDSLIIFPEGTRNMTDAPLLPFKSGIYNLATQRPHVELIPCWIENMSRVLPKGEFLPVPLLCRVVFGAPIAPEPDEERHAFLARAHEELLKLDPRPESRPASRRHS
ncbi:lysophospholipid acyltransferase family protein [Arvimicrobium flavum]|uniref:lysophospholipid acyltransferase family protein n=1 Tax=Arvimicrobium flavum TaxID=3393320 RepID=UPI00237B09C9|nr:lysophospholipid acyltransferase family protein [Mesorhizobium shangrilense]